MHCLDTEFKNENDDLIDPSDIKEGQKIKACVNKVVIYNPITFDCYAVWIQE